MSLRTQIEKLEAHPRVIGERIALQGVLLAARFLQGEFSKDVLRAEMQKLRATIPAQDREIVDGHVQETLIEMVCERMIRKGAAPSRDLCCPRAPVLGDPPS